MPKQVSKRIYTARFVFKVKYYLHSLINFSLVLHFISSSYLIGESFCNHLNGFLARSSPKNSPVMLFMSFNIVLQERYDKLEEMRKAINDRYPFDDLFVQWPKVDYEEKIITSLMKHLESFVKEMKNEISEQHYINQKK